MGAAPSERVPDERGPRRSAPGTRPPARELASRPVPMLRSLCPKGACRATCAMGSCWSTSANGAGWPRVPHPCEPACVRGRSPGKMLRRCILERSAMAVNCRGAFPKGPRTAKTPLDGNVSLACIQIQLILARYACHVSKKPRKVPLGNTPREHLAAKGRFRRPKPSNHAWRTNLAIL